MDINWFDADYLPWLILFFPLLAFSLIVLFTSRSRILSQTVALIGITVSWVLSMVVFVKTVWAADETLGDRVLWQRAELDGPGHEYLQNGRAGRSADGVSCC